MRPYELLVYEALRLCVRARAGVETLVTYMLSMRAVISNHAAPSLLVYEDFRVR